MAQLPWAVRRLAWLSLVCVVFVLPIPLLAIAGAPHPIVDGLVVGMSVGVIAFYAWMVVEPASFIRWRRWMNGGARNGRTTFGLSFDTALGIADPTSDSSRRRVRVVGIVVLAVLTVSLPVVVVSLWFIGLL